MLLFYGCPIVLFLCTCGLTYVLFFVVLLGSCSVEQIGSGVLYDWSLVRSSCHRTCVHFCVNIGVHFQLPCPLISEAKQARTVGKFTQGRSHQGKAK
jgi:hypothetical protein